MFTLKDFTEIEYIKEFNLVTKNMNLDKGVINHISVIELPVDNFIRKNELVLTTAIGCYEDEEVFLKFVEDVYYSKAAGIVISAKKPYPLIPQSVIDFADEKDFHIIYIPWEYRFGEIIEIVVKILSRTMEEENNLFDRLQRELLFSYLNKQDISMAAKKIYKYINYHVVITNEDFTVKGSSYEKKEGEVFSFFDEETVTVGIYNNSIFYGYLIVLKKEKQESIFNMEQFEKYVVVPLSLWFNEERVIKQAKDRNKDDFIHKLISGGFKSEKGMAAEFARRNLRYNPPYTCIVGEALQKPFFETKSNEDIFHLSAIRTTAESILNSRFNEFYIPLVTIYENNIVIFTEGGLYEKEKDIHKFLDEIEHKLSFAFSSFNYFWGISEVSHEGTDFKKKYKNAKLALRICIDEKFKSNRGTYEDTSIFKILSNLLSDAEVLKDADMFFSGLFEQDNEKGKMFLKTLATFISNNYNLSKTAKDLNLHRQSLIYRMEKIEELMNISLHNHSDLFLAEVYSRLVYNYNEIS